MGSDVTTVTSFDFWSLFLLFTFIYNALSDSNAYKSHSDIKAKWRFINRNPLPIEQAPFASAAQSPTKHFYKIPMKQTTAILLSLRNLGESTFNISSITGYLHAAHRHTFHVQNIPSRSIQSILQPNSEISFEYQFLPWHGLPAVDYVFSADVKYKTLIDEEMESKRISNEYLYNFVNVTVNIYDSAPIYNLFDFELFFMFISMAIFWMFVAIIFYELWWFPNQVAQGNTPLPTQEWVAMVYREYGLANYYNLREVITKTPNPMSTQHRNGMNGTVGSPNKRKSKNDSWLAGTSVSNKKKKKKRN